MRKFFNGVVLGLLLGFVAGWYFFDYRRAQQPTPSETRAQQATSQAVQSTGDAVYHLGEAVNAKLESLELRPADIKEELARTGKVVRRKAREWTAEVADAATDTRITAAIKTKLAMDKELSARNISVATSAGQVTLTGTVASPELIGKAALLALETDGVREVTAQLQVAGHE